MAKAPRTMSKPTWTELADVSVQSYPYQPYPHFLQIFSSRAVVIVMDMEFVKKVGDPATWLNDAEANDLASCPTFLAKEGDAIWIPHGSLPIICGIPLSLKVTEAGVDVKACKANQFHTLTMCIHPVFDIEFTAALTTEEERINLAASWLRSKAFLPATWQSTKAVQAWVAALDSSGGSKGGVDTPTAEVTRTNPDGAGTE